MRNSISFYPLENSARPYDALTLIGHKLAPVLQCSLSLGNAVKACVHHLRSHGKLAARIYNCTFVHQLLRKKQHAPSSWLITDVTLWQIISPLRLGPAARLQESRRAPILWRHVVQIQLYRDQAEVTGRGS